MSVTIFYSPQPDERDEASAAFEYAKRACGMLSNEKSQNGNGASSDMDSFHVQRLSPESLESFVNPSNKHVVGRLPSSKLFIVSCSADGSVDRSVRKFLRGEKVKQKTSTAGAGEEDEIQATPTAPVLLVALLGHARCENSARQMKDTIYNNGRKFHKCLQASSLSRYCVGDVLEIQAELEGPDAPGGFDEWFRSNLSSS